MRLTGKALPPGKQGKPRGSQEKMHAIIIAPNNSNILRNMNCKTGSGLATTHQPFVSSPLVRTALLTVE